MNNKRTMHLVAGAIAMAALALPLAGRAQAVSKNDVDGAVKKQLTPEQRKALADAMKQLLRDDDTGLKSVVRPDGTEILDLQGRFQSVAVARKENGKTITGCVSNPGEADAFANGATPDAGHDHAKAEEK